MAPKRQPAKQRRQTQNQRERAAREARRLNAGTATEVAAAQATSSPQSGGESRGGAETSATDATAARGSSGGSVLSRLRGASASGRAVRTRTPVGTSLPPGHRAALSALMAAVAGAVVGAFLISVPIDASGDAITSQGALVGEWTLSAWEAADQLPADATADQVVDAVDDWTPNGEERYGVAVWPLSLLLLLPVAASALAFQAVAKRKSSKVVMGAMYATLFGALLSQQLIIFIPTVIGVGIASYQVRKAEAAAAFAAQVMEGGDGDGDGDDDDLDDDIIDVEEAIDAEEATESDELIEAEAAVEEADVEDGQRRV
jgi:hypothetical protein